MVTVIIINALSRSIIIPTGTRRVSETIQFQKFPWNPAPSSTWRKMWTENRAEMITPPMQIVWDARSLSSAPPNPTSSDAARGKRGMASSSPLFSTAPVETILR